MAITRGRVREGQTGGLFLPLPSPPPKYKPTWAKYLQASWSVLPPCLTCTEAEMRVGEGGKCQPGHFCPDWHETPWGAQGQAAAAGGGGGKRIALLKGSPEPVPSKSSFPGPLCCCGCASVACVCVCGPPLLPGAAGPEEAPPFSGLLGDARGHKGLSRREVPRAAGGRRKLPSNFLDNREGCALCALLQTHNRTPTKAPGSQQPSMPRMPLLSEGR